MKVFGHVLRALMAVMALCAGLSAWVFARAPERLAFIDTFAIRAAADEPMDEAGSLAGAAGSEPSSAIRPIERFLETHASSTRGDRDYLAVRLVRKTHVLALLRTGQHEEAAEAAEDLAAHDAHDLDLRLWAGRTLVEHEYEAGRGVVILEAAFAELPALGRTARELWEAYGAVGRTEDALDTAVTHVALTPRPLLSAEGLESAWDVRWTSAGGSFQEANRASSIAAVTPQYIAVTFELPAGAARLRIDPPGESWLAFDRAIFATVTDAGPSQVDLSTLEHTTNEMSFDGATLIVDGTPDPWFAFTLPDEWHDVPYQARLVLATKRMPTWIEGALAGANDAAFDAAMARLTAQAEARGIVDAGAAVAHARANRERILARQGGGNR